MATIRRNEENREFVVKVVKEWQGEPHDTPLLENAVLEHNGHEIGKIDSSVYNASMSHYFSHRFSIPHPHEIVTFRLEFQDGSVGELTIPSHLVAISFPMTKDSVEENDEITGREPTLGGKHRI